MLLVRTAVVLAQADAGVTPSPAVVRARRTISFTAGCVHGPSELGPARRGRRLKALDALWKRFTPANAAELERAVVAQNEAGGFVDCADCFWDGVRTSRLPWRSGALRALLGADVARTGDGYLLALSRANDPQSTAAEQEWLSEVARALECLDGGAR
ncbi:MAG: hypothetical protein AB1730_14610 [Myxococcota bacterium]